MLCFHKFIKIYSKGDIVFKPNKTIKNAKEQNQYSEMVSTIFELNPDAIVITTLSDSEIIDCNQEYLNQIGYSRDEVIGRTSLELNLLSSKQRHAYVNEIQKKKTVSNYEVKVKRKDGSFIYVLYSARFITINDEIMILNIGHDISRRRHAEEALKESEEKYRSIVDNIQDAFIRSDKKGKVIMASRSAAYMYRFGSPEEMIGISALSLYKNPEDRDQMLKELKKLGKVEDYESIALRKDGTFFPLSLNAQYHYDCQGQIQGTEAFVRDITERKKAEQEIEYHALLLSKVNDGVIGTDSNFQITYWNKGAEQMYGYTKNEAVNMGSVELLRPIYAPGEREKIITELNDKHASKTIISTKHRNGNEIIAEVNSTRIIDEYGNTSGYVVVYRDITERKRTEEIIQQQADLIELSFDAIIVGKFDGGIESWNQGAEKLYGYSKSEAVGHSIHDLLSTTFPIPWSRIEIELKNGGIWEGELQHYTKFGQKVIVSSRIQVVKRDDGTEVLLETNRDITERKGMEVHNKNLLEEERQLSEELIATNEELQSTTEELRTSNEELIYSQNSLRDIINKLKISNKELEQFAYVASHDLQEPLRMVSSFTQLLERRYKNQLDEDADDYIGFVVEGAQRMKNLIDDLLAFSRLNTEIREFEIILMEVVLDDVLTNLKASIMENNAQITHDTLPTINGDSLQINQLLQNLIANAIKFHGENPPQIHISAQEFEKECLFHVSDNGIGIDPKHQEQIFNIFKRLHTRIEYDGTGIGLSICKRIVERHGGRIWVESEPGKGSTFYFTIPYQ